MDKPIGVAAAVTPSQVRIDQGYWRRVLDKVRTRMLPYQWEALNDRVPGSAPSYAMANFRIAAGDAQGEHGGHVFQDSDLAKWLEAVACQLETEPSPELEAQADEAIDLIARAQMPDGYVNTYYQLTGIDKRWTNLRDNHEMYCAGHMLEAAVAYARATGKRKLLDVMVRMVDHIAERFGDAPGKLAGYPGHEELELALCRLYDFTGEERFLQLAAYFINQRGQEPPFYMLEREARGDKPVMPAHASGLAYWQAHAPVRAQHTIEGHSVRALYLASGMADVALRTGDASLWQACEELFENVAGKRMYVTGGVGSTHVGEAFTMDYDLPNDTAYAETCASIALVFFCHRMLRGRLDGRYGDVMERALYNTCMAGMDVAQEKFFYVNPLSVWPEASHKDPGKRHALPVRPPWFGCACCPPNLARLLTSLGTYTYTTTEHAVQVHLYVGGEASLQVSGQAVRLHVRTDYPAQGRVALRVSPGAYDVQLRVPGWCEAYTLLRNGQPAQGAVADGYLTLCGPFAQEEIVLDFAMPPTRVYAHPLVREDAGKVAILRGPIVYCLEEADNGDALHLLRLPREAVLREAEGEGALAGSVLITAQGVREVPTGEALYTARPAWREEPAALTFIPYALWANRGENEMEVWVRERA